MSPAMNHGAAAAMGGMNRRNDQLAEENTRLLRRLVDLAQRGEGGFIAGTA